MQNILAVLAKPADSKQIWEWRNDPVSRMMSLTSEEISWESHSQWFLNKLNSSNCVFYLGETPSESEKIGVVRFDLDYEKNQAQVSINLNPLMRGKGYSAPLLRGAIKAFRETNSMPVLSTIKRGNIASIKCFANCGFVSLSEDNLCHYFLLKETPVGHTKSQIEEKLKLIDEIEKIRSSNNVNWMNLLRLAFRVAPDEAKQLFSRINEDDKKISQLLSELSK